MVGIRAPSNGADGHPPGRGNGEAVIEWGEREGGGEQPAGGSGKRGGAGGAVRQRGAEPQSGVEPRWENGSAVRERSGGGYGSGRCRAARRPVNGLITKA
jgi:hypothetical protein